MIPATPVAGTKDPNPLVTGDQYSRITGDSDSLYIDASLNDALVMLQEEMRRTFLYAQYTERLYLYKNGMVYPTATPLDSTKGVLSPGGSPPQTVGIFQGNGIWVGWYIPLPSLPMWTGVVPPQTDITYWGGWTGPAGPGPFLPPKLTRVICKVAWYINHPAALSGMPGGVKSVSIGGVSMSGDLSSMTDRDFQLARDIKKWRKPAVRAWDAQVT